MDLIDWLATGLSLHWWNYALAGFTLLAALVCAVIAPGFVPRLGREFARRHHAYVEPSFGIQFDRAKVRELRRSAWLLGFPVALMMLSLTEDRSVLQALAPALVALSIGTESVLRLRNAGEEFRVEAGAAGIARGRAVGIRDYVSPAVAWGAVALWIAIAGIAGGLVVAVAENGVSSLLVAHTVAALVVTIPLILLPLYWHSMVSRPEPSQDAAHLYLQDAWRADLLAETITSAHLPILFLAISLLDARGFPPLLGVLGMLALAASMFPSVYLDSTRNLHFRKRLWPTLKPGQVLMPGDSIPAGAPA